jgi:hypothetical protein
MSVAVLLPIRVVQQNLFCGNISVCYVQSNLLKVRRKIMKKTILSLEMLKISANFKGEIENVKMGRGGGRATFTQYV